MRTAFHKVEFFWHFLFSLIDALAIRVKQKDSSEVGSKVYPLIWDQAHLINDSTAALQL